MSQDRGHWCGALRAACRVGADNPADGRTTVHRDGRRTTPKFPPRSVGDVSSTAISGCAGPARARRWEPVVVSAAGYRPAAGRAHPTLYAYATLNNCTWDDRATSPHHALITRQHDLTKLAGTGRNRRSTYPALGPWASRPSVPSVRFPHWPQPPGSGPFSWARSAYDLGNLRLARRAAACRILPQPVLPP